MEHLRQKLESLSCHFTWEEYINYGSNRSSPLLSTADFHDGEDDDGSNSEIHWNNLMGYNKSKDEDFEGAKKCFGIALEKCTSEDEKLITLSCMAWLLYKEAEDSTSNETRADLQEQSNEKIKEVIDILQGREMDNVPEVLFEKAFVVIHFSNDERKRFEEANCLIDKALEENPGSLLYKFTKIKNKQRSLLIWKKIITGEDKVNNYLAELDGPWNELIKMTAQGTTDLHADIFVSYALFLNRQHRDYGKTGGPYAERAKLLGARNPYVLRKVAQFYMLSAGNDIFTLDNALVILRNLLKKNPDCYKTQSLLGQVLCRKYKCFDGQEDEKENIFAEAENNLKKSLDANPKFPIPGMDMVRLHQFKYETTGYPAVLVPAERILHQMVKSLTDLSIGMQGGICTIYGQFLNKYAAVLASHREDFHHNGYSTTLSADHEMMMKIKEAFEIAQKFEESQDLCELHKAEQIFLSIYSNVADDDDDDLQSSFYQAYSSFMKTYCKDIAMMYFIRSLNYNPLQSGQDAYGPLEMLAKENAESENEEKCFSGFVVLSWLYNLRYEKRKEEKYISKAQEHHMKAVQLKEEEGITEVLKKLSSLNALN